MQLLKRNLINKNVLIPLILILTLGAILRFYGLGIQSFWLDELLTWGMSNQENLTGVINTLRCCSTHPPGYLSIIYFVEKYIGDSELILRFPSAVSGVLSIFVIFLLGKRLYTYKEGLIASALMAVLWSPIYYSQEARSNSLLLLFTLFATYFWITIMWRLNEKVKLSNYIIFGYFLTAITSSYLHYFGLFLVVLQGLGSILFFIRRRSALSYIFFTYFLIFLAYLPWFPAMLDQMSSDSYNWVNQPELITSLKSYFNFLFNTSRTLKSAILILYSFLFFNSLYNIFKKKEYRNIRAMLLSSGLLLVLWLIVPFVLIYIKSVLSAPFLVNRNLIISLPAAYLLLSRSITQLPFSSRNQVIIVFVFTGLILSNLIFYKSYYSKPHKEQFRESAGYIVEHDHLYKDSIIAGSYAFMTNYYFERKGFDRRVELGANQKSISGISKVISTGNPRYVWSLHAHSVPDEGYINFLNKNLTLLEYKKFIGAEVWLFENRSPDFYYLGFYNPEEWPTGRYRWSKQESIIGFDRKGAIELVLHVSHPDVEKAPVILTVFLNKKPIDKVTFTRKRRISKRYYIPKASKDVQQLFLKISRTWNPYKYGVSKDTRDLGIAVSEIKFLDELPKDGIGFYQWETWGGGQIPGWPHDLPKRFRWTGMRASMRVESGLKNGITLFLLSSHPDINKSPVKVEIIGDDGFIREEIFTESKWKKVILKGDEIKNSKVLTIQVNRTWNPESAGVSNDSRELGVAVAIPEK